jgi:tetratricopeptide (TPR) repeat protein
VNQLTLALAGLRSFDGIIVASACLVKYAPGSPRTANLFGAALHTAGAVEGGAGPQLAASGKLADAVTVLRYVLTLAPASELARLNLANTYLDLKQYEQAKALAQKVLFLNDNCREAWRVMATYWYVKNDASQFRYALLRAAKFKGYVKEKSDRKKQPKDEDEPTASDSEEALRAKADQVKDCVPLTTADVIEDDYPSQAKQIRDQYGKLPGPERMTLPELPQTNTNDPKAFKEHYPIVHEWAGVFIQKHTAWGKREAARMGFNPAQGDHNPSKAQRKAIEQQNQAAAKKQVAEAMQQAQQIGRASCRERV